MRSNDADKTLRQKAYTIIQGKLLSGEIRVGDLVSELALAEEIGMSRTPVREAIGQLEIEGLFNKVPRVGTIVRLPDAQELRELYEVREALEGFAAYQAAPVLTQVDFAAMKHSQSVLLAVGEELASRNQEVLDQALLQRFFEADIAFHTKIVEAAGNRRTSKIVSEFRVVQRVFEYDRMAYTHAFIKSVAAEHGAVIEALRCRSGEDARTAMANHIASSRQHAMKSFNQLVTAENTDMISETSGKRELGLPKYKRRAVRKVSQVRASVKKV